MEDSTVTTLELGSGVKLTCPLNFEVSDQIFLGRKQVYITDPQNRGYMWIVFLPDTDGIISNDFKESGLSQV